MGGACAPDLGPLAQQLAAAARAPPARDALAGTARALSGMLVANMRMLRVLRQEPGNSGGGGCAGGASGTAGGLAAGLAAEVAEFVAGTLLHTPVSSLSNAYLHESAAALAVCLAPPPPPHAASSTGDCYAAALGAAAPAHAGRAEATAGGCSAALPVVGELVEQLLEVAFPTGWHSRQPQDPGAASQARCALQALVQLPPTGAALLRGVAHHLLRTCGAAARAQRGVLGMGAGAGAGSGGAAEAMELGAALFESSHELLELFQVCEIGRP